MVKRMVGAVLGMVILVPSASAVSAQPPAGPAGHWEGAIETPGQALKIEVDLAAQASGKWEGTITIPAQNLKAFPLADITVQGSAVTFAMNGVPGNPAFKGTTSNVNKSIAGEFSQGGATLPFTLEWKGEAKIDPPAKSTPISKDVEGAWEGTLNVSGTSLRLTLKLANHEAGATGSLVSIDQGSGEIPISSITQTNTHLKFVVGTIGGTYEGDLKDGQLAGTWTQGPNALPLVFSRPTK